MTINLNERINIVGEKQNTIENDKPYYELIVKPTFKMFYDDNSNFGIFSVETAKETNDVGHIKTNSFGTFTIKGTSPLLENKKQYTVRLKKELSVDKKGRESYDIISIYENMPSSREEQEAFLKTLLTENQTKGILEKYPNDDVIELIAEGKLDYSDIKGIGDTTFEKIQTKVKENIQYKQAIATLSNYGVSFTMIKKMVNSYGSPVILLKKVEDNPYILSYDVDGIGFKKADTIALSFGIPEDSKKRIEACILFILRSKSDEGHSWVTKKSLGASVSKELGLRMQTVNDFIDDITNAEINSKLYVDDVRVALKSNFDYENIISYNVKRLLEVENNYIVNGVDYKINEVEEEQGFSFTDEQRKAIELALQKNVVIINGKAGSGKALENNSLIKTPNGDVKIGDIKVGDEVFNTYGSTSKVIGVYPQGEKEVWEVEFSDGVVIKCCEDHLWDYQTRSQRDRKLGFKTATTREIQDMGIKTGSEKASKWNIYIPMTQPVQYKEKDNFIPPYLLGALIGDGNSSYGNISITNVEEDVLKNIEREANKIGYHLSKKGNSISYSLKMNEHKKYSKLRTKLEELGLYNVNSYDKFIPRSYLESSVDERIQLLNGLIDTDGECRNSNYYYSTTSRQLCLDIVELVRSLGMTASYSERQTYYTYNGEKRKGRKSYRVSIKTSEEMPKIHTSKKHESKWKKGQSSARRTIRRITPTGVKKEMTCIEVDSKDSLFLTDGFVVTHNTSVVKGIVSVLKSRDDLKYATCALSGKASQRIKESSGLDSSTIHRLLHYNPRTGFIFNEDNKLEHDVIILDEASMVDAFLASKLLCAIKDGAKLIILGDTGQLQAIGSGNVLSDLMTSNVVPRVELTKVHRQAQKSGILSVANMVREGRQFTSSNDFSNKKLGELKDLWLYPFKEAENVYKNVIAIAKKYKGDITEFQVIVPMKKRGKLSTKNLNEELQDIFNPDEIGKPSIKRGDIVFRQGSKIIQRGNDYDLGVFNGTIGMIEFVDNANKIMVVNFEGVGRVELNEEKIKKIDLAYALTIHSVQGSQWTYTVVAFDYASYVLLSRELIYTALTRASKLCFLTCELNALIHAVKTDKSTKRNTFLVELLQREGK